MHIISYKALKVFYTTHPDARRPLDVWYETTDMANWNSIMDVRNSSPHADAVVVASGRTVTVFNIGGNKYRLIAGIHYNRGKVHVLRIMTHKEYSLNRWKETL